MGRSINPKDRRRLIDAALAAHERAYAPYSNFHVGAAVLAATGPIHVGANVENASYGLTLCAERVALASAIAAGDGELIAMAVASRGGAMPCGACRQFAAEFHSELPVFVVDASQPDRVIETSIDELLPHQFELRPPG